MSERIYIKNQNSVNSVMPDVIIALLPTVIWGVFIFGFRVLTLLFVSVLSSVIFELAFAKIFKIENRNFDFSVVVTAMMILLNLPVTVPLYFPIIASFIAVIVAKAVYGGVGKNIVNPALFGIAFLLAVFPKTTAQYTAPLKRTMSVIGINPGDITAVSELTPLQSIAKGQIPAASFLNMFIGNISGTVGEISKVLILLGVVYLAVRKIIKIRIPITMLLTVAVITYLFPQEESIHAYKFMMTELLSGGLIFASFFSATDCVTSPTNPSGQILYGFGCGVLTVLFRYFGKTAQGVPFAILTMNFMCGYIDLICRKSPLGVFEKPVERIRFIISNIKSVGIAEKIRLSNPPKPINKTVILVITALTALIPLYSVFRCFF